MHDSIFINPGRNVLVDDNPIIIEFALLKAKSLGIDLVAYQEPDDFLRDIKKFDENTAYFFGSRFGPINMTGTQLAERLRSFYKHAKIVFITIFQRSDFKKQLDGKIIDEVLEKGILLGEPVKLSALTPQEVADYYLNLHVLARHDEFYPPKSYIRHLGLTRLALARETRTQLALAPDVIVEEKKIQMRASRLGAEPKKTQSSPNRFIDWFTKLVGRATKRPQLVG